MMVFYYYNLFYLILYKNQTVAMPDQSTPTKSTQPALINEPTTPDQPTSVHSTNAPSRKRKKGVRRELFQ
jgi:hypothetical protein